MKKILFIALIIGLALNVSCSKDDGNEEDLISKWLLTESLIDPGDGSGRFQKVDSNTTIEFFENNTVKFSNSFCNDNNSSNTGTYSIVENKIYPDCNPDSPLSFKIDGKALIIYYTCYEACAGKFEKIR